MSDATGAAEGVGGAGGVGASSAGADAAAAQNAVGAVAESMVEAATGPLGVDVGALAETVAATQAQVTPDAAQSLQAAVEASLSAVDAAAFGKALDQASPASLADRLTASPLDGIAAPAGLFNAQGQAIDTCGNLVSSLSVDRSVPAHETAYAKAVEHIDRIAGGPISGPAYAASYLSGADEAKLDQVHAVGKAIDGALGVQRGRATKPSTPMADPVPANWNYTQR